MAFELLDPIRAALGGAADEAEPGRERREVAAWKERLDAARMHDRRQLRQMRRWRQYLAGRRGEQEASVAGRPDTAAPEYSDLSEHPRVLTNYIFSAFMASQPEIYAQNPEVQVRPAPSVDDARYELTAKFARTCEILVKRYFEEASLKARMKGATRVAMACSVGWLKVGYYKDVRTDTILRERDDDMNKRTPIACSQPASSQII